jgi:uncharacterized protein
MDITESGLILAATILMITGLILAFVPAMPGPFILWGVACGFGALEGFQRLTPTAAIAATVIMVLGATSDLWLRLFGVQTGGLSCLSSVGSFIGGMVGTVLVPIPLIGTMVGVVGGALLVELVRIREWRQAMSAGKTAFKMFVLSYVVQLVASITIFAVFIISLEVTK